MTVVFEFGIRSQKNLQKSECRRPNFFPLTFSLNQERGEAKYSVGHTNANLGSWNMKLIATLFSEVKWKTVYNGAFKL